MQNNTNSENSYSEKNKEIEALRFAYENISEMQRNITEEKFGDNAKLLLEIAENLERLFDVSQLTFFDKDKLAEFSFVNGQITQVTRITKNADNFYIEWSRIPEESLHAYTQSIKFVHGDFSAKLNEEAKSQTICYFNMDPYLTQYKGRKSLLINGIISSNEKLDTDFDGGSPKEWSLKIAELPLYGFIRE